MITPTRIDPREMKWVIRVLITEDGKDHANPLFECGFPESDDDAATAFILHLQGAAQEWMRKLKDCDYQDVPLTTKR